MYNTIIVIVDHFLNIKHYSYLHYRNIEKKTFNFNQALSQTYRIEINRKKSKTHIFTVHEKIKCCSALFSTKNVKIY